MRPKIGVFSFSSCEGCQLQILNLEREIPAIAGLVELVNFREAMNKISDDYAIAFVEGSITREKEVAEVEAIRKQAKILVSLGACAHLGGVNSLKNPKPKEEWLKTVYKTTDVFTDTFETKRVSDVVKVDYDIPGCPIDKFEFVRTVFALLAGVAPRLPDKPVCAECRVKPNPCLVEDNELCLGSITRAGCGAICPTYGEECVACRGVLKDANIKGLTKILNDRGHSKTAINGKLELFNLLAKIEV
ncbi:MAG: NADH:ubiquinone oxidoreductase [Deltaproteobacteria bacterium]|nr:NADH:ubiquinone oxidoreductase [Deltaproteobacteria bacterium]